MRCAGFAVFRPRNLSVARSPEVIANSHIQQIVLMRKQILPRSPEGYSPDRPCDPATQPSQILERYFLFSQGTCTCTTSCVMDGFDAVSRNERPLAITNSASGPHLWVRVIEPISSERDLFARLQSVVASIHQVKHPSGKRLKNPFRLDDSGMTVNHRPAITSSRWQRRQEHSEAG